MNDRSIAVRGGWWIGLSTATSLLTQVLKIAVLARFLAKSDFGMVSIVNMVIGLCVTFSDLGFSSVIMYKKKLSSSEFSSLYWTQFIVFAILYVILAALSSTIANFYDEVQLAVIIKLAAISIFCQGIGGLYDSVLQKNYQFKTIAIRNIVSTILSLVVALFMAIQKCGIYSLVVSSLLSSFVLNFWNFISGMRTQRLKLVLQLNTIKPLIRIGLFQTYTRIADYISSKLDVMILGKTFGTEVLGVYDLAKDVVLKLIDLFRTVVSKVGLPVLSNKNDNPSTVILRFCSLTKIIAFLCIPICVTIAVFSRYFVLILYGPSFIDAAYLMSIFSIMAIASTITSFFDMLGIAKGRTDLNFKNTIFRILLTTPTIIFTSYYSISCVAWSQLFISLVTPVVFWFIVVRKTYPMSFSSYFSYFKRILFLTTIIGLCFYLILHIPYFNINTISPRIIILFVSYCLCICLSYFIFLKKDLIFFKSIIFNK